MNWRRLGLALGAAFVLGGLAVMVAPGLASGFGLGSDLLTAVAMLAGLGGVAAIYERVTADHETIDPPTPERRRPFPTPGDEFDRRLAALGPRNRRSVRESRQIRDRLDELAIAVLVRDGDSEDRARERLAAGTWTDDPYAAAFFAEASASDVPLEDRLRAAFSAEPNSKRRARHAVDALARIASMGPAEREP